MKDFDEKKEQLEPFKELLTVAKVSDAWVKVEILAKSWETLKYCKVSQVSEYNKSIFLKYCRSVVNCFQMSIFDIVGTIVFLRMSLANEL